MTKFTAEQLLDLGPNALRKMARRHGIDPNSYPGLNGLADLAVALAAELNKGA